MTRRNSEYKYPILEVDTIYLNMPEINILVMQLI